MNAKPDFLSPATELAKLLADRSVSSVELLELQLERVERLNPPLNALVTIDHAGARAAAERSDRRRADGEAIGPLDGLPISIKDSVETAGVRTTSGSLMLANYVPAQDAIAVARLKAAGAVVFAKSNLPPFASDFQTDNPVFGRTNNPWNLEHTPGGSSGGSASAIAAGLSPLELGSDIGGSVRQPAHFCGIYSHKPTYELIPILGHIPPAPGTLSLTDMATVAPLARSASDLRMALDALVRPASGENLRWLPALAPVAYDRVRDYRVAVWADDAVAPVDAETRAMLERVADTLEAAGCHVDRSARPNFDPAEVYDTYLRLVMMLFAAGIEPADLAAMVDATRTASPDVRLYVDYLAQGKEALFANYASTKQIQALTQHAWAGFFRDHDVLVCPAGTTVALAHDASQPAFGRTYTIDGVERPYGDQSFFWNGAFGNFAQLPSTTRPIQLASNGLPMGVQILGDAMNDRTTIAFAGLLDDLFGTFRAPPGYGAS